MLFRRNLWERFLSFIPDQITSRGTHTHSQSCMDVTVKTQRHLGIARVGMVEQSAEEPHKGMLASLERE